MDRFVDRPPTAPTLVALHHLLTHPQLLQLSLLVALVDWAVEGPVVQLLLLGEGPGAAPHAADAAQTPADPLLIYRCSAGGRRQLHLHIPTELSWRQDDTTGHLHTNPIGDAGCAGSRGGVEDTNNAQLLLLQGLAPLATHSSGLISPSVAYIADHISLS